MPGKVKVKIIAGRNLPVMDRSSYTTDAYVEIKLGNTTYKTDVCKKSLHPQWNSEWYRFEVDDAELQDEPLQIRLMDHDTYSANDAIGKVYIDLNPLLLPPTNTSSFGESNTTTEHVTNSIMSGWLPVFDTMHGIRGEVNVTVKMELFSDLNKFRQSSCGIQFFYSCMVPQGHYVQIIHGFVEELVVNNDPEYQWIDKIRTPRASNEARQALFFKLSGELQRKIGLKVLELGGNAVIGYNQCFDLEGESGIVARGIGTAVSLTKIKSAIPVPIIPDVLCEEKALNYLKFLGSEKSFHLNRYGYYAPTICTKLYGFNPVNTLEAECSVSGTDRKTICRTNLNSRRTISTNSLNRNIKQSYRAYSLRSLLKQEDERGVPSTGISQRLKNFKHSSRTAFSKKISTLKGLLTDSTPTDLNSDSLPLSTKGASNRRKIFKRATSESSVMAQMLVKSVMRTSLDCINETDTVAPDQSSNRKMNIDNIKVDRRTPAPHKSMSEPGLLQSNPSSDIYSNVSSSLEYSSSSSYSSGEGEDEEWNLKSKNSIDFDTVSSILRNVSIYNQLREKGDNFDRTSNLSEGNELLKNESITIDEEKLDDAKEVMPPIANIKEIDDFDIGADTICDNNYGKSETQTTDLSIMVAPANLDATNASKSLFRTAMQTMLLEKLNLVGTCTPSDTPISLNNSELNEFEDERTHYIKKEANKQFINESTKCTSFDGLLGEALSTILIDKIDSVVATSNLNIFPSQSTSSESNELIDLDTSLVSTSTSLSTNTKFGFDDNNPNMLACLTQFARMSDSPVFEEPTLGHHRTESMGTKVSPVKLHPMPYMHRRSSDSDLSITPKGNSLSGSDKSVGTPGHFPRSTRIVKHGTTQDNFEMLEYPFITMTKFPPGFILYLGGIVGARSVKLLERITNLEEPESRDTWWTEIRMEIRSHARSLNCNSVIGYAESCSICDDVCVLSASGTAAIIGFQYARPFSDGIGVSCMTKSYSTTKDPMSTSLDRNDLQRDKVSQKPSEAILLSTSTGKCPKSYPESPENEATLNDTLTCSMYHLPYSSNLVPLRTTVYQCGVCRNGRVPDVLMTSIDIPEGLPSIGKGCFIQAFVCRPLKELRSESSAKDISDGLPFLEYELHRILLNKIKIKGMNAVFGLQIKISLGTRILIGVATGTGVYLLPLPSPSLPKLVSDETFDEKKLAELQKLLYDTIKHNKETYQLKVEEPNGRISPVNIAESDEKIDISLSTDNRDCSVLEIDDPEDMEIMNLLMEPRPPDGFHVVNTEFVPGLEDLEFVQNLQVFTQIWKVKVSHPYNLDKSVHKLLHSVYFKLRKMIPCVLCDLQFRIDLPEVDEIQINALGIALGLDTSPKSSINRIYGNCMKEGSKKLNEEELMFALEEDAVDNSNSKHLSNTVSKNRPKSPSKTKIFQKQRHVHGVDITPLSYIPGAKIEKYFGNINFFFIRETTSLREEGGLSGLVHGLLNEVLAIVRAHITALGGNAMVAYYMSECILSHSLHKNQAQCLINVGGDVVLMSYPSDE